jgi:phosphotransferase system HPr-like phosphotransfer protein
MEAHQAKGFSQPQVWNLHIMIRTFALAATLAAIALPALAGTEVKINVAGLDAKAAHQAIVHAAQEACRSALADQTSLVQYYTFPACMSDTVAAADARYASMRGLASR